MPPKEPKTKSSKTAEADEEGLQDSDSSLNLGKDGKPKKPKPLTKKEREKMKKLERELKEALVQLRKQADQALAEFKAMKDAAEKKAKKELFEHNKRTELLAGTCETFRTAKSRLMHENNKLRDAEIWNRYITTDRMPYPENVPNMHDHLYLWRNDKSAEYMEFALGKCNSYVDTLKKLDELIEYPLYSTTETVNNWKELRREWREEFLYKLDKACFNMIKNLAKNFKQDSSESHVYMFDQEEEHVDIGICAYAEDKSALGLPLPPVKLSPKIHFPVANVHIVMPAAYRTNPFILRLIHLDQDFFSESSLTYYCPEGLPMEPDLLSEIDRCFEAKKEAKSLVADREREKVRQAKLKVVEIQTAAKQAEKSFQTFQETSKAKKKGSKTSLLEAKLEMIEPTRELAKKKVRTDVVTIAQASDASIFGVGSVKRPRGVLEEEGDNISKSVFQSAGTQRALDAISMRSGMRKKQDRTRKLEQTSSIIVPSENIIAHNIFYTHSMISLSHRLTKVQVHRASELCFEAEQSVSKMNISRQNDSDAESFESLDLMFGTVDEEEVQNVRPLRHLVKETVIVDRDAAKRPSRIGTSISYDGKRGRRPRGRSRHSTLKLKGLGEEAEEAPQSASEIFEINEDNRQEQYMSSLLFQTIPHRLIHLNLREYSVIGDTYILDIISHESQPHKLHNGNTVQIFYGEMNIKRDAYAYDYKPPPQPNRDDPEEPVMDPGLQHLLHVKLSLPTETVFFEAPIVALWDRELKFWTRQHVHKLGIDLETRSASFSIDRVWPFAFFMKKYHLLPFVSWNMTPKLETGGVTFTLECTKASFEFDIVGFQVCLSSAVTSDGGAMLSLSDIIGEFMHLHRLIDAMKSKGLNIFPDEDAFLYIQANSKDVVLEDHTYLSMAMFADSLEFLCSDLNADPKRQKLAFRVREWLACGLEVRYRTVVATSLSAQMFRIGLEDVAFDDPKLENLGFCPDVYSLLGKSFAHVCPSLPPNPLQILAVYSLLSRTKVLSYCGSEIMDISANSSTASKWSIKKKKKKARNKATKKSLMSSSSDRSVSLIMSTTSAII